MKQSLLASRLNALKDDIVRACDKAKRDPQSVKLVAVSKGQPFDSIIEAYELGIRDFGESYVQEFSPKQILAANLKLLDIRWHFLGALQGNKIKAIAHADVIQSVDSLHHAELLNQALIKNCDVFLQVNLSGSLGRRGFRPQELKKAYDACVLLPRLNIKGLMTILPLNSGHENSYWFTFMAKLREDLGSNLKLSMGMSGDFQEAIVHGADIIRIGTSLFGEREIK